MVDFQRLLFDWVSYQPAGTGFVIFLAGFVYGFLGFQMFKALLVLATLFFGGLCGAIVAMLGGVPVELGGACGAVIGGAMAYAWSKAATNLVSGITCALLSAYLGYQLGLPDWAKLTALGVGGGLGCMFAVLCPRTMPVVLTVLQGAVLLIVGFVGVATHVIPSLGYTFTAWAASWSLLVPAMMVMIIVTAYSYQAMQQQGDMRTGRLTTPVQSV